MQMLVGYTVLGRLGSGTSGTVWKAHDDTLDRVVAIKALHAPTAQSRAQWRSEAQVLAALDDPHLVAVYGYAENAEGAYIVEEWIDGSPLGAVLTAGPLSTAQALGVIRGALLGLAHVHARGLVHGDIAPANILLDTAGTSKLVDFGLSTSAGAASSSSGTTAYASPEAKRGDPVTAPSDVYAAAAVLAYLLRGRAALIPVLDDVDPALRPVLRRALDPDPARRYPDAAAFLAALEQDATARYGAAWWTQTGMAACVAAAPAVVLIEATGGAATAVAGTGTTATAAGVTTTPLGTPSPGPGHALGRHVRRFLRSRRLVAVVGGGVAVVAAAAVVVAQHGGSPARPVAATRPFAAFAGAWGAHEVSLIIDINGAGSMNYADLTLCPTCSFGTAPRGTLVFVLKTATNGVGTGSVTVSSDAKNYAVGDSVDVSLSPGSPGQLLNLTIAGRRLVAFCNGTSAGQCGA